MKGVLLVNLGSPDSTSTRDVRKYLDEFLMDKRVIDTSYLMRVFLVRGIILNTRPKKTAAAYKKIWWKEGSPLIEISRRVTEKIQAKSDIPVEMAMRYGSPSMKSGIQKLADQGVTEIFMIPLYPQFAMASTETVVVLANKLIKKHFPQIKLIDVPAFYNKPDYIEVLSNSIKRKLEEEKPDHLLFSYHGLPERHLQLTDVAKSHCKIDGTCCNTPSPAHEFCYRHQCYETTKLVVEKLGLKEEEYSVSFQSRLGKDPWIQPFTDVVIKDLPEKGIKKLSVVIPSFVADCLETLEEIAMEAKKSFLESGGEEFNTIPCLNEDEDWIEVLETWIHDWKNNN